MTEFLSLRDAIAAHVHDGSTVALEGFTHLIPFAAGHEIIRQGQRDLTLVRMTPDLIYDQLIGMGCARKLVFSWGGNPGVGSLHRLRDAVEHGWPRPLEIEEHSHAAMAAAYAAGAAGLPCAILRGYAGSDLVAAQRQHPLGRVPVHRRAARRRAGDPPRRGDHPRAARRPGGQRADRGDRRRAEGGRARRAARRSSPSRRSSTTCARRARTRSVLPYWTIAAIAVVPGGARPSYAHGYYARDNAFYIAWDAISRDRERFRRWMREHVLDASAPVEAVA